jgi:2-aminoethylphosphonate-pyruvate transaminase
VPYALTKTTATQWSRSRAIDLWIAYRSDLAQFSDDDLRLLKDSIATIGQDGASFKLIDGAGSGNGHARLVQSFRVEISGPAAPSPFGITCAMLDAGIDDVRRVGVIGSTTSSLEAGHRAGVGAIVGLAPEGSEPRKALVESQPDYIVDPAAFAELDRRRYGVNRRPKEFVLLNPGPAVVSDRVHRAIGGPDLCHREPEYTELLGEIRRKLLRVAGCPDDWALLMLSGSGTAAMEGMTISSVRPGRKLLVCRNGIYGDRIETIARRHGIDVLLVTASDLEPIDPALVAQALDDHPDIDAVAVIHHETTTGLLNPVAEIASEANRRGVLVVCDAISSLGAEELQLDGAGIDFVASTSNKCLHGLPGCSFILVSPRGQQRINEVPPRSLYLDLSNYLKAQEKQTVPFTPAIPALYSLDAALDELLDGGIVERRASYQARMDYLDSAFSKLGLEPRIAPGHRSRSVRSLPLPEEIAYQELHDAMKQAGYVIYAGLGDASETTFRVCALGALSVEALEGFIESLSHTLATRRTAESSKR